mgnify:CR=1 FL=1
MSQEVYEMITRLDRERIETHLVVQCAPMISGMKISNFTECGEKTCTTDETGVGTFRYFLLSVCWKAKIKQPF